MALPRRAPNTRDEFAAKHLLEHSGVDLVGLANEAEIDDIAKVAVGARARQFARDHHVAVLAAEADGAPAWALIVPTITLLIAPAAFISTISTVALSVTRRPLEKRDSMPSFESLAPICGPPP